MPITGPGMVAFAHLAFREVKAAFAERLRPHAGKAEYELTADDCHFVRRDFEYERFDEYTYPSADLQLGAASIEAVERGDYQWVLAELHPSVALLHHGFYWSCPDKDALGDALRRSVCGQPNFHFGYFAVDFTATTAVRFFDALPDLTYFVAPQRGHAGVAERAAGRVRSFHRAGHRRCLPAPRAARTNISAPSPAPGRFRSVFIPSAFR